MNRKMRRSGQGGIKSPSAAQRGSGADPAFINAFIQEGRTLLDAGRGEEAMEIAKRAIHLQETDESKAFFVECVKEWSYFPGADAMRDVIVRALRAPWAMSGILFGISKGILERDPVIGPAMRRATAAWPRRLSPHELLGPAGLAAISADPLLLALLETSRTFGLDIERFLTSLRAGLLEIATQDRGHQDDEVARLCCALARQCFINEYVFDLTADEHDRACRLRDRISDALGVRATVSPMAIAVLAAYFRLDCLPQNPLLKRTWPSSVVALLEQQIHVPAAERRQRTSIPRITPIFDDTSIRVRQQYEENPFPRWVKLPAAVRSMPLDEWFRTSHPASRYREIGKINDLDVLVAGCGTGQHSIIFAQTYPGAKVLAVDLSISSLCYAKVKTRTMGLDNIEYAQADILELAGLDRKFDVISSCGVLHHLADMEKGWRTLLSLLRPDGCMHIGLYSELARRDVVVAQQWLRQRGFTPSIEDIRRARQELAAAAATNAPLNAALQFPDFYATSECRDLLLHTQERRCTIPQIQAFLEENELEFLGFRMGDKILNQFRARFSRQSEYDLRCWHEFEIEHPDTFRGMYEFWIQKKRP